MKKIGNVLWGIVFIVVGIIWALNALGITHINLFFHGWWTLFIIIPCFIGLFKDVNKTWDLVGLIIGIVLLLVSNNVISFAIIAKLLLPAILIIIGISFIFGDRIHNKLNQKIKSMNKDDLPEYCATFSAQNINLQNTEFKGANATAVFGSVDLNLTTAIFPEESIVNCSAIFGGITIFVPNNIAVEVKSTPIFGGVSNKTIRPNAEKVPTIYVNSFCLFGGVTIK